MRFTSSITAHRWGSAWRWRIWSGSPPFSRRTVTPMKSVSAKAGIPSRSTGNSPTQRIVQPCGSSSSLNLLNGNTRTEYPIRHFWRRRRTSSTPRCSVVLATTKFSSTCFWIMPAMWHSTPSSRSISIFPHQAAATARGLGQERSALSASRRRSFQARQPSAEVHFYDTGHFALETHAQEIAIVIREFLGRKLEPRASAA